LIAPGSELLIGQLVVFAFFASVTVLVALVAWKFKLLKPGGGSDHTQPAVVPANRFAGQRCDTGLEAIWLIVSAVVIVFVWKVAAIPGAGVNLETGVTTINQTYQAIGTAVAIALAIALHASARWYKLSIRLGLGWGDLKRSVWFAIVASVIAIPLTIAVNAFVALILTLTNNQPSTNPLLETIKNQSTPTVDWLLGLLIAIVGAPVLEEILFRGHVQTACARFFGPLPAVIAVSGVFALVHPPTHQPAIFALSVCLGLAYERTGRLWVPILMHVAFNALMVLATRL